MCFYLFKSSFYHNYVAVDICTYYTNVLIFSIFAEEESNADDQQQAIHAHERNRERWHEQGMNRKTCINPYNTEISLYNPLRPKGSTD